MQVSVVLCTYSLDAYDDFQEAAESVLSQTYNDVELVVVVDGSEEVFKRADEDYGESEDAIIYCNDENVGLLKSRNVGTKLANGDVVAFIDDDAVPAENWVEELVRGYEEQNASAVGGKMTPRWVAGKPNFLPAEFYWLVGVTHQGFADGEGWVRNTFGSNISFCRDVFLDLGGFDIDIGGRKGDKNLQGGETELCARLAVEYDEQVWYTPEAIVEHKVFAYRTKLSWLVNRAFWQGYSKRAMEVLSSEPGDGEEEFLGYLLISAIPHRLRGLIGDPSVIKLKQLFSLALFTVAVGFGYVYGLYNYST